MSSSGPRTSPEEILTSSPCAFKLITLSPYLTLNPPNNQTCEKIYDYSVINVPELLKDRPRLLYNSNAVFTDMTNVGYIDFSDDFYPSEKDMYLIQGNRKTRFYTESWKIADALGANKVIFRNSRALFTGFYFNDMMTDLISYYKDKHLDALNQFGVFCDKLRHRIGAEVIPEDMISDDELQTWIQLLNDCSEKCDHKTCEFRKYKYTLRVLSNGLPLWMMDKLSYSFNLLFSSLSTYNTMDISVSSLERKQLLKRVKKLALKSLPIVLLRLIDIGPDQIHLMPYANWLFKFLEMSETDELPEIFSAQGNMCSSAGKFVSVLWSWADVGKLTNAYWQTIDNMKQWITDQIQTFLNMVREMLIGIAPGLVTAFVDGCETKLTHFLDRFYEVGKCLLSKAFVGTALTLFASSMLYSLGLMTKDLILHVFRVFWPEASIYVAQGPETVKTPSLLGSLVALFAATLAFSGKRDKIRDLGSILKPIMLMATVGTFSGNVFQQLLTLLPATVSAAVVVCTGDKSKIMDYNIDSWFSMATILNQFSKQPRYLASKRYQQLFDTIYKSGHGLMTDPNLTQQQRSRMVSLFTKMVSLSSTLEGFRDPHRTREMPFHLHLCGPPGIGKTTLLNNILSTLFKLDPGDPYQRPLQEFWDGYVGSRHIAYDEFLVGPAESQAPFFSEILQLVSTAKFIVNSASLGPSLAGVKGTPATPKSVTTICNSAYPSLPGYRPEQIDALHRRRMAVIHMEMDRRYDSVLIPGTSNIDMTKLTEDERQNVAWINFRILPPIQPHGFNLRSYPTIKWVELKSKLGQLYTFHKQQNEMINSITGADVSDEGEVDRVLCNLIRQTPSFITRPPSLLDILSGKLVSFDTDTFEQTMQDIPKFEAQGRSRKRNPTNRYSTEQELCQQRDEAFTSLQKALGSDDDDYYSVTEPKEPEIDVIVSEDPVVETICKNRDAMDRERVDPIMGEFEKRFSYRPLEEIETFPIFKWIFYGTAFTALIAAARKIFSGVDSPEYEMESSALPSRQTQLARRERFKPERGFNYYAQTGAVKFVKILIDGDPVYAVPIKKRYLLTYAHIVTTRPDRLNKPIMIQYITHNGTYEAQIQPDNIVTLPQDDLMMIDLDDKRLPFFPNLLKQFWTESEYELYRCGPVTLLGDNPVWGRSEKIKGVQSYAAGMKEIVARQPLITSMVTRKGDCGRPLVSTSNIANGKILGIHTAGSLTTGSGIVMPVTREMVDDMLEAFEPQFNAQGLEVEDMLALPNCAEAKIVPFDDRIFLNRKSKIKPSMLAPHLVWNSTKFPSVLSDPEDDPIEIQIRDILSTTHPEVDKQLIATIYSRMMLNFEEKLNPEIQWRELSFEEACSGVPGILSSIRIKTSAGWPLVRHAIHTGKRDFVWFEGSELHYSPIFREMVEDFVQKVRQGQNIDSVYLGYMKDELVSQRKFDAKKTRIIYASSLIATVAFRMLFGGILMKFQNSWRTIPMAIGMNQYSYDMNDVFNYLSEVGTKFVAGDYSAFDRRYHPAFRDAAYLMLGNLLSKNLPGFTWTSWRVFVNHETQAVARLGKYEFKPKAINFSGCFLTTIINCLVNEGYMRYVFQRLNPGMFFDVHVRLKVLGDDHVLCFSDQVKMDGISIQEQMKELGQEYTSTEKDKPLEPYSTFDQITFLGAHPRFIGRWTGAAKRQTLQETLYWTRDNNESIIETAIQMIELASQWDVQYFHWFRDTVVMACQEHGYRIPYFSYDETQRVVANRTTGTGSDFSWIPFSMGYEAQGPGDDDGRPTTSAVAGLTTFQGGDQHGVSIPGSRDIRDKILNEQPFDVSYAVNTKMFRDSFPWAPTVGVGVQLISYDLPFDLLTYGEENNIQNMPFDRMIYWRGNVELTFQINANPFAQGLLCVYFQPLGTFNVNRRTMVNYQHIFLSPNRNPTGTILIPYRYPRQRMNTYTRTVGEAEFLGTLKVAVYSQLVNVENSNVTVTMYSRFPNSEFTMPRPIDDGQRLVRAFKKSALFKESFTRLRSNPKRGFDELREEVEQMESLKPDDFEKVKFEAQGQGGSKTVQTYNYNIGDVAGDMPIENTSSAKGNEQTIDTKVDATIPIPADNPPLASGSVPVHMTFSGLSTTTGVEPTVALQLAPDAAYREHANYFNPEESSIEWILGRRAFIDEAQWNATDAVGTRLLNFSLDSMMGRKDLGNTISPSIAVLNLFMFWHCDIEIELLIVRTNYQSGRLRAVIGFGAPSIDASEQNTYYNEILEFGGEQDRHKFVIPYNAQTEYLRTYEGPGSDNPIQDYSLGQLAVYVANKLVVTSNAVPAFVNVLMFTRFLNPRVCVPRPLPLVSWDGSLQELTGGSFEAQGPQGTSEAQSEHAIPEMVATEKPIADDVNTKDGVQITAALTREVPPLPCRLQVGEKFEKVVSDLHEVARRMVPLVSTPANGRVADGAALIAPSSTQHAYLQMLVYPSGFMHGLYAAWAGSIRYRIYQPNNDVQQVTYWPIKTPASLSNIYVGHVTAPNWKMSYGTDFVKSLGMDYNPMPKTNEMSFAVTGGTNYIDVLVPFQTHYNFLLTRSAAALNEAYYSGVLGITKNSGQTFGDTVADTIYTAIGDDFRYGIWRPFNYTYSPLGNQAGLITPGTWCFGGYNITAL